MKIEARVGWKGKATPKVRQVMRMFGVDLERLREPASHAVEVEPGRGDICYITGPSGAGKSLLLRAMYEQAVGSKVWLDDIRLSGKRAVVDCIEGGTVDSLRALSRAGLSDVFCILNQPARLSDGQKWRYRLARAMTSGTDIVFADEFCSTLDRVTAATIAWNVRKWSRRTGVTFVLASCHEDLLADLQPDVVVVKHLAGDADVVRKEQEREECLTQSPQL
jgi:ABC-type ATPase with predicted acetyltransferase domain